MGTIIALKTFLKQEKTVKKKGAFHLSETPPFVFYPITDLIT